MDIIFHSVCELPWIGNDSWLISSITFNFHFKFSLCFKHVISKLYWLVCVYVHFRIWRYHQGGLHRLFGEDNFGKPIIICPIICSICMECSGTLLECEWIIMISFSDSFNESSNESEGESSQLAISFLD
jgi:hypothetical protein